MGYSTSNPRYIANKRTGGKRTIEQREADKHFCADLFVKGYTYRQIAEILNAHNEENGLKYKLTYKTIFCDINQVLVEWKKERFETIDNYIYLELKKLDKIEVELWEAWEKSKSGKRKTKIVGGSIKDGAIKGGELDSRMLEDTNGNPKYLDLLLKVQERRAKLLGYNAPVRLELENRVEEEKPGPDYDANLIPDSILLEIANKLQDAEFDKKKAEDENELSE